MRSRTDLPIAGRHMQCKRYSELKSWWQTAVAWSALGAHLLLVSACANIPATDTMPAPKSKPAAMAAHGVRSTDEWNALEVGGIRVLYDNRVHFNQYEQAIIEVWINSSCSSYLNKLEADELAGALQEAKLSLVLAIDPYFRVVDRSGPDVIRLGIILIVRDYRGSEDREVRASTLSSSLDAPRVPETASAALQRACFPYLIAVDSSTGTPIAESDLHQSAEYQMDELENPTLQEWIKAIREAFVELATTPARPQSVDVDRTGGVR